MRKEEKFLNWLVELRDPENSELLESVVKAFGELLEYNESGSAGTNNSNNATYMDNQLNTKPGSAGFQDNIMEEVEDDGDEMLTEGLAGAAIQGVKALASNPAIRQGVKNGAKALYNNPVVRGAAKEAAVGVTTAGINRVGQGVQNRLQPQQQVQQQPQQGLVNVQLNATEMELIKQYRQRQGQAQTESILEEFVAPAIVTAASGAPVSANPDENMISPMVSDMQPTASNQMAVTDSATDDKESDNDNVKELKELTNDVGSIMEKLKKIMARSANGREVIMEDTIPKY